MRFTAFPPAPPIPITLILAGGCRSSSNLYCTASSSNRSFSVCIKSSLFCTVIRQTLDPHFSPAFYCGGGSGHVYCVALLRAPRRTVEYACGALGCAPCIHARLRRLATKPCEKCGLIHLK